jgi:hypothetical protein
MAEYCKVFIHLLHANYSTINSNATPCSCAVSPGTEAPRQLEEAIQGQEAEGGVASEEAMLLSAMFLTPQVQ